MKNLNPLISGILGSSILMAIYFLILSTANSFSYAINQLSELWYWFIPLVLGFGIQVTLFSYIKKFEYDMRKEKSSVAASTGISATSMVICCLHHVGELLPLLGISAASIFLIQYQVPFIVLGISSNLFGITLMLVTIQVNELYLEKSILGKLFLFDMKKIRTLVLIASILLTVLSFAFVTKLNFY